MYKSSYPRRKVFFALFLCPLIFGFFIAVVRFIYFLVWLISAPQLLGEVSGGELILMPLLVPLIAQLGFMLPFLAFAMLVSSIGIYKSPRSCLVIALVGGGLAICCLLLPWRLVLRTHN